MSTAVSILRHGAPDPTDLDPATGWCGIITAIIARRVVGEVWQYIDTAGAVSYGAEINIDGHGDTGSLIKLSDPQCLRDLAATACLLAHELGAETTQ